MQIFLVSCTLLFAALSVVGGAMSSSKSKTDRPEVIEIGDRKQLFIDGKFITEDENITLRMNPPVKGGPVLVGEEPWEQGWLVGSATVLEHEGRYRMWYISSSPEQDVDRAPLYLCYAESKDGLKWTRPHLGLYEFRGSKANNILLRVNIESASVFIDPKAPAEQRYKLVANMRESQGVPGPEGDGIYIYTSPDGLRWTLHPVRLFHLAPDTNNMAFYDPRIDRYVIYVRVWNPLRKIGRIETDDIMKPWPYDRDAVITTTRPRFPSTEIPTAFGYDEKDPVPSDHYTPAVIRYPFADDAYFAFPSAYHHFSPAGQDRLPDPPKSQFSNDGPLDIQMAVSRDGKQFHRVERAPYIDLGLLGTGEEGSLYMLIGFLRRGDDILQYYHGFPFTHGAYKGYSPETRRNIGTTFVAKQRLDGFVSADAPMEGGSFVTPALVFEGRKLTLNMNASAMGEVKVELRDERGNPIEGFTFENADPLHMNRLQIPVTWGGNNDVSSLQGVPIRIAFRMRATKLYAFQFAN